MLFKQKEVYVKGYDVKCLLDCERANREERVLLFLSVALREFLYL